MAGLTKEQREAKKAAAEAELRAELEAKIRAELEAKYETASAHVDDQPKIKKAVKIPGDTIMPVVSNFPGRLIYNSKRMTGYSVDWDEPGYTEYMEVSELMSMRSTDKRFFEDNWIYLEDGDEYTAEEVYRFLKVDKFYKNVLTSDEIVELLDCEDVTAIRRTCFGLAAGIKQTVAAIARQKKDEGTLDLNVVPALEDALGIQLEVAG